ncbi:uncharacterized protein CANTADRAFT_46433 [Suhomyces tanzawaensis NRRL Y-17324]|uniref:Uncharacterized protein n=1 Tax=Suhomyces tanzawaensis NRRL Y-17324 TaxID=984487 RepID=A0A1E4SMS5_9ASCO|nr:uncharacterized protein CANTADRAFT_46433 [Suhomyces tanzawaensis NRRL Y-17324]ODV80795.1 hypothetical protein CANTADRAFT_46433 [Suhomyces tanzawaensis NRRL Y-17324]
MRSKTIEALTLPVIDLNREITHPYSSSKGYTTKLFSHNRQLLIGKHEVVVIQGSTISKKYTFNEDIVTATYTCFNNNSANVITTDALVVCLAKSANIYYKDGRAYVVSFPFVLKNAFPFDSGLILEKDQSLPSLFSSHLHPQQLNSAKFLTLVDPIGDFRIVTTSSTSIISRNEELMTFPRRALNKSSSLCATYNGTDGNVLIYQIRASTRNNKILNSNSSKYAKRKHSLVYTPNPSRILEDEILSEVPNSNQNVLSLNMEKKRTSTLLSDVSSIARMSTDPGFSEPSKKKNNNSHEYPVFKKDMILTRVDVLGLKVDRKNLQIYGLIYEDQEAIVIVNKLKKETRAYIYKHSSSGRFQSCYTFHSQECIPLNHPRYDGFMISLNEGSLTLVNPFLDIVSPKINLSGHSSNITRLIDSCDEQISLLTTSGKSYNIRLRLEPLNSFVLGCLKCFKYLSGSKINETVWLLWRTALMLDDYNNEWNAFVIALLSIIYPFDQPPPTTTNDITKLIPKAKYLHEASHLNYSLSDLIPYIALSMHLLREELRLDLTATLNLNKVGLLLAQLTTWMGWPDHWSNYYMVQEQEIDSEVRFLLVFILESPPNLLESLASLFSNKITRYLTFSQLVEEGDSIDALITPRTHYILKFFEVIVSPSYGPSTVIDLMCEYGITQGDLETYPPGIAIPLKEAILICQENPMFEWTKNALELVGRKDLSMFLSNERTNASLVGTIPETKSITQILSNVLDKNETISPWDGQSEAERINITKLMFDYDRRYFEITTLLHQTKTQTATLHADENITEYDLVLLQRELASLVAMRTLTIPLGRASLFYASRKPLLTEKFPIPKFNLNTLIAPTMTNIVFSEGSIPFNIAEWGSFHNGVSSGMSISRDAKGISGSWIIFNKPPDLNAQHAGFLLGLGLNGHLKKLEEWHIYNYLGPKHPLTSVGLLIGMAASIKGSMDNKLTKVLSVHAVALLPQGANDLNVPVMVQTAGLIGIGLLYLESQHRRMSEILLSQITSSVFQNDSEQIHEGYRLAAGIALGFVNLGKGDDLRGLHDTHVVDKLISLAIAMKDHQPVQELDKSCCGAIIALGFIYMRTENTSIANKLRVPNIEQLLDYIRPDLLLLRCVAKNLVMWNRIEGTVDWVESELPTPLHEKYSNSTLDTLDSDQLSYFYILGGSCLSIAAKYASSHNITARDTLLHFLDMMMTISSKEASNYDQKIAHHSAMSMQNLLALSVSVVMAGSGDLESFRRIRVLHNDTSKDKGYGNYMAINTALGFLFLGGGQYAFGNSNFAVASLITALYPIFPNQESEYEVHLQALRHFWALSVEPRCLVVRDVTTNKPCKIPVKITMKNGTVRETLTPCLLPALDHLQTIETESSDHFQVKIEVASHSEYLEIFKNRLTIYVYKRKNYRMLKSSIGSLLSNENKALQVANHELHLSPDLVQMLEVGPMAGLSAHDKQVVVFDASENDDNSGLSLYNIIDTKLDLSRIATRPASVEHLWNLRLLFAYADTLLNHEMRYISLEFVEQLKQLVWALAG